MKKMQSPIIVHTNKPEFRVVTEEGQTDWVLAQLGCQLDPYQLPLNLHSMGTWPHDTPDLM